ncbi:short-chain dehydrogenase [Terrabacter sp. Soil811]|uniref:SDR family NAD(P)-dependent oxidoreductase n=1 Tax=Terrabacter sp. Soil811 TaxID=1736419 RepID=UPI0006F89977|nr:SDR family oxidoreductase [Terrabacter sp. Soil811]KRF48755.1 short-chain dehydrogenase [Terrabacter sp. Soil811]
MQIEGRVFVVTGGGGGIGREVVLGLLARDARVAAVDLRADGLAETVEAARAGDRLSTHVVDVTDRAAVEALADAVVDEYDRVDGLLNVAGIIQPFVPFSELDLAAMEKVMAVNFWGVVHTVKAFLPHLVTRPQACVVNVSSMGAFAPVPGQAVYGASKAAVMLLTEGLWAEQRGTSVAVTCVFPGGVATDISGHSGVPMPDVASADEDAPTSMTSPVEAARRIIVGGVEEGRFRVVIGRDARTLDRLTRLAPRRATELVARRMASLLDR